MSREMHVHIWRMPGPEREFAPLALDRRLGGLTGNVTCLDWSHDSRWKGEKERKKEREREREREKEKVSE